MPSRNTNHARKNGYSDMKRMQSGQPKNFGQNTGNAINTATRKRRFKARPQISEETENKPRRPRNDTTNREAKRWTAR